MTFTLLTFLFAKGLCSISAGVAASNINHDWNRLGRIEASTCKWTYGHHEMSQAPSSTEFHEPNHLLIIDSQLSPQHTVYKS